MKRFADVARGVAWRSIHNTLVSPAILLPRIIGDKKAREMILLGDIIDAAEALRVGLVNYLVPSAEVNQKLLEILSKLRELSSSSLGITRRALDAAANTEFDHGLKQVEKLYRNDLMETVDANEGLQAFIEKRKPDWKGK